MKYASKSAIFFAGCRLATSIHKEQQHIWELITSSDLPPRVLAIAEIAFIIIGPEEMKIQRDSEGTYDVSSFEGVGYGSEYCRYIEMFGTAYNALIDQSLAHLMHPARMEELLNCGVISQNDGVLAERLITYRLHGQLGFRVAEMTRQLNLDKRECDELSAQLASLSIPLIKDKLEVEDLHLIPYDKCRKYVCQIFNALSVQNELHLLELPEEELYQYKCHGPLGGPVHKALELWVKAYMEEARGCDVHFGAVVRHLKALAHKDLNASKCQCIHDRLKDLKWCIEYKESQL